MFHKNKNYLANVYMEFVRTGNASATMVTVEDNAGIQHSFVTKLKRKKMRSLKFFMTTL